MKNKPDSAKRQRPELLLGALALFGAAAALLVLGLSSNRARPAAGSPEQIAAYSAANPFEEPPTSPPEAWPTDPFAQAQEVVGYTGVIYYATDAAGGVVATQTVQAPLAADPSAPSNPSQWALAQAPQASNPPQAASPPQTASPPQAQYPVNLNTASRAQLETLPGIGPVKADAILAWKAAHGGFANPAQLLEVKGIGEKTLANLLPYVTV